jgi:hypothetical protein
MDAWKLLFSTKEDEKRKKPFAKKDLQRGFEGEPMQVEQQVKSGAGSRQPGYSRLGAAFLSMDRSDGD